MEVMEKYLKKYAEPIANNLIDLPLVFENVVVIPAFDEMPDFLEQQGFAQMDDGQKVNNLMVVVVNAPDAGVSSEKLERTQQLLEYIRGEMNIIWRNESGLVLAQNPRFGYHLLAVDCVSVGKRLPVKMGVGLARKIGADIAVNLIFHDKVCSHIVHSTDADVQIPRGYFASTINYGGACSGYTFPFRHHAEKGFELAMQLYEFSLHYYVAGLEYAGSKYAFHTVGSCLAFSAEAYAKVRGFPKRAAGEDFYLLNKLAKVDDIEALKEPVIEVAGRGSDRVPFGTGPALTKISNLKSPEDTYLFYSPQVFRCLKIFLKSLPDYWGLAKEVIYSEHYVEISAALESIGFYHVLDKILNQAKSREQFIRASSDWFDAFKTLKFIHYLRNNYFPSVAIAELRECDFVLMMDKQHLALFN